MPEVTETDVVVVGAGNAALCTALAARESGADVLGVERAEETQRGGNSTYTAGAFQVVYEGVEDLSILVPDLTPEELEDNDYGSYPEEQFFDDMAHITQHRTDPTLAELLITCSFDTLQWMTQNGIRPIYQRQACRTETGNFRYNNYPGGTGLTSDRCSAGSPARRRPLPRRAELAEVDSPRGRRSGRVRPG